MTGPNDFFEQPPQHKVAAKVEDIRDRFIAVGIRCRIERDDPRVRLIFDGRSCDLVFIVNDKGRPLTASMPNTAGYDTQFAQILFQVFETFGWKFHT